MSEEYRITKAKFESPDYYRAQVQMEVIARLLWAGGYNFMADEDKSTAAKTRDKAARAYLTIIIDDLREYGRDPQVRQRWSDWVVKNVEPSMRSDILSAINHYTGITLPIPRPAPQQDLL